MKRVRIILTYVIVAIIAAGMISGCGNENAEIEIVTVGAEDVEYGTESNESDADSLNNADETEPASAAATTAAGAEMTGAFEAETEAFADEVPELVEGYSEMVGPWAYVMYAMDSATSYTYHEAYDGYIPAAGDLIVTGDDESDTVEVAEWNRDILTGLGYFSYGPDGTVWNGHILMVISVSDDGILTCTEGNTIAPGQDLSIYDGDYIYLSSIDYVDIDYETGETLTEDKPAEKAIRGIVETNFSEAFTEMLAQVIEETVSEFEQNPDSVRREVMDLYFEDIDWCGLYIQYILNLAQFLV